MWLVLCHAADLPAIWAYQRLRERGLAPLELVTAETLVFSLRWEHRLGAGGVTIDVRLADGRSFSSQSLRGVINRVHAVPLDHWRSASQADRDYVLQEQTAFYTSWLYGLPCPVLNRPTAYGLSGQWRHESEWVWLAQEAGLPAAPYRQASDDGVNEMAGEKRLAPPGTPLSTVIVVAGEAIGAGAPADVLAGCARLAQRSGTEILGVDFAPGASGPWTFAGATPAPDLSLGGPALIDALLRRLRG